jgi:hypothetical protein
MKLTKTKLKQIIKEEISRELSKEVTVDEGVENITPENIDLAVAAFKKLVMSPYTGPIIAAAFAALGVEGMRDMLSRTKEPDDQG